MQITLNKAEQALARIIATGRYRISREAGLENKVINKMSSRDKPNHDVDLNGFGGELAVAKMFNLYPDTSINTEILPYDLTSKTGKTIDVKTTKYETGVLYVRPYRKPDDCDIFVLVVGFFPNYEVVGWASSDELMKEENLRDLGGYGKPVYALEQSQLHQFKKGT